MLQNMILKRLRYNDIVVEMNSSPLRRKCCGNSKKNYFQWYRDSLHGDSMPYKRKSECRKSGLQSDFAVVQPTNLVQEYPR